MLSPYLSRNVQAGVTRPGLSPNPGPGLGPALGADSTSNGIPITVAVGPDDEFEIVVRFPSWTDGRRNLFSQIRADASVAGNLEVGGFE